MLKARRLDEAVAERDGITRSQARSLIMEGRVRVDGVVATKAGQSVAPGRRSRSSGRAASSAAAAKSSSARSRSSKST